MPATCANLVCVMMLCACAVAFAGCMSPGAGPSTFAGESANQATALADRSPTETARPPAMAGGDASSNMAGVLEKLQQIRAIDPAAEQTLIDKLRHTPAESWPLVAEQFRASLAYREQLAAKNRNSRPADEPALAAAGDPAATLVDRTTSDEQEVASSAPATARPHVVQVSLQEVEAPAELAGDEMAEPIRVANVAKEDTVWPADASNVRPAALEAVEQHAGATVNAVRPYSPVASPPPAELDWQQLVEEATAQLSNRVSESPGTTAEVHQHVSLRILKLLAGDTEGALQAIPNISPAEQDYWSRQLFALATYLDHHSQPDDKRRAAAAVTHLDEAVSHLREIGSLALRNLSFCKNVYGYGAIEPYDDDRFSPGDEVSLYVEIENYHSRSTEDGFCTLLGSSYELLDEGGERIGGGEFPDVDDCCRSRRRDFHIQYGLTLPSTMAPGHYRLQLVVKDRQSDKLGSASVPFEIRGRQL